MILGHHQKLLYQLELEKLLHEAGDFMQDLDVVRNQMMLRAKLSEKLNIISSLMIQSVINVRNKINSMSKKKKKKIGNKKFKRWWDAKVQELHQLVISCYISYKLSNFNEFEKKRLSNAKREFRKQKRINLSLKRSRVARQINDLFKLDKQKFWTKIRKMQNIDTKINIRIDELKNHYEQIFTTRNKIETYGDMCNERFVSEYIRKFRGTKFDFKLEHNKLTDIIKNLTNNKSVGLSDVSYEMLKYANNNKIYEYLTLEAPVRKIYEFC